MTVTLEGFPERASVARGVTGDYLSPMTHVARLDDRALIRISGPEARPFLHNLLTQDVDGLAEGEVRYGALLSPPGRLLFDLFLWGEADGVVLEVAAARRDALTQRLSMYRLRAAVEIAADDRPVFACLDGMAEGFTPDPRLPDMGGRRLGAAQSNVEAADWRRHEMRNGVGGAADWPDDKTYPIEANFDLLNGIDFHKGCFVGQETTSRMKRRGAVKNRFRPVVFEGPPPPFGAEVLNGEMRAGEVRGGVDDMALALLRLDRLDGPLTVEGRPVEAGNPPWLG